MDAPRTPRLGLVIQPLKIHDSPHARILVGCEDVVCQRGRVFTVPELLRLLGPEATALDIERRMRCRRCGRLAGGVRIIWDHNGAHDVA